MNGEVCELWFDGLCEPMNPGGWMCSAWVVKAPGMEPLSGCVTVPPHPGNTNNVAEWRALIEGVKALEPAHRQMVLVIRGDSNLVVNQLTGKWACHKPHLAALRDEALVWLRGLNWRAEWVPREQNAEADAVANEAYFKATGKKVQPRLKRSA